MFSFLIQIPFSNRELLNLNTINILGQTVFFSRTVLCILEFLAASLASTDRYQQCTPCTSYDNQKYLQILPNFFWGQECSAKLSLIETTALIYAHCTDYGKVFSLSKCQERTHYKKKKDLAVKYHFYFKTSYGLFGIDFISIYTY